MQFILSFLAKNWKLTVALLVFSAMLGFFSYKNAVMAGQLEDMTKLRNEAEASRVMWHDSHVKLEAALSGVEADKTALLEKLDQMKVSEQVAVKAASRNAAEAAKVTTLLRQIQESANDPQYSDRIRSRAVDFLRARQNEESQP